MKIDKKLPREGFKLRSHHIVIGLIAIVVAIALAANYYLW